MSTPTVADPPAQTSLHTSFLKSLQLTVTPSAAVPSATGAPVPDTGVEVPSNVYDFSEGSGSLADKISKINKEAAAAPAVTPPVVVAPVVTPVETPPVTPAAVTPAPALVVPELPRVNKLPDLPKPFLEDTVLPPPPINIDLSSLDEDEADRVRTAMFAEQKYPERYAGRAKQIFDFITRHKNFMRAQEAENPNVSFDGSNEEYGKFLKSNPLPLSASELKRFDRERMLEEAASLAEKRISVKTKRLEDEVTQLKAAPIVERTINDYKSLVKELMPKDDDPIVQQAATGMASRAVEVGQEFLMLSSSLKQYDSKNDIHKWLADFIQEQGELYQKTGHASLKRGTKNFVPRSKFNSLPADERAKHFTFTDEDVLQLIAVSAKAAAEFHSTNERDRLKKAGYTRVTAAPVAPPVIAPVVTTDVSARASPTVVGGGPVSDGRQQDVFLRYMGIA